MATCSRAVWRVVSGCQRLSAARLVYSALSQTPLSTVPVRTLAVARAKKKATKDEEEVKKKRVIDKTSRPKPDPVDDVYIQTFYAKKLHRVEDAVELLKTYSRLDFAPKDQPVLIDLRLNMALEKKKKVDPFVSTVLLPHPIKLEMNKVLVFTEDPDQVEEAQQNGAAIVGGQDLVQPILDDKISADFYIAVPEIIPKLLPLKNKLRKKFPKSNRGTIGVNIPKMLDTFTKGHEYMIQRDCYIVTQFATLDMPSEHIMENLRTIIAEVCSRKPASFVRNIMKKWKTSGTGPVNTESKNGPFIERAIVSSETSEALWINLEDLLAQPKEDTEEL